MRNKDSLQNGEFSKDKGEKWIVHGLVNFCLAVMIFVAVLMCGFVKGNEIVPAFKSYRGVIYQGNEQTNKVALMINVYWGTEYLEGMLETLQKHNAKVTFFVGETWVKENSELLKKMASLGHEIGNHGSNHKEHGKLSYDASYAEIQKCHERVKSVLGIDMNLFAPPGGSYNAGTVESAKALSYKTILWTHDTIDWKDQDTGLIFERATKETQSGALILMHPTKCTSEALERVIIALNGKNLTLDTVSNTIKD